MNHNSKIKLKTMKNLFKNISKLFAISLVMVLVSCGSDDEDVVVTPDAATISITSAQFGSGTTYEATAGETVTFSFTISAPGGFNNYTVSITGFNPLTESKNAGETITDSFNAGNFDFPVTEANVGSDITVQIDVVDDNNLTSSATLTVTVVSAPANSFSAFMLAAPLGDLSATSFFSTNTGDTYSPETVNASADPLSNDIDFGYYYGSTNNATIASPAGFESSIFDSQVSAWGTKNSTTLLATTLTSANFLESNTWGAIETAFATGSDGSEFRTNLAEGDVIAFETSSTKTNSPSKKGLILIKAINGTFNENDNIEIEVVVQD